MLKIQDFADIKELDVIISNWALATGMAAAVAGMDGENIFESDNYTDFRGKHTRGFAAEKQIDQDDEGAASGSDFEIDLTVNGEKVGTVTGGTVLSNEQDKEEFRKAAREIDVDEDQYIKSLEKVTARPVAVVKASAGLLEQALNNFLNYEYNQKYSGRLIENMTTGIAECEKLVGQIQTNTKSLNSIQSRQNILALNASIEAARAGDAGKGFAVVAKEVGTLSQQSKELNEEISKTVLAISNEVHKMTDK